MGILTTLQGSRIYLDVNIWIYALEQHPTYSQTLTELFQQVDQRTLTIVTSELSLAEALVKPMREQDVTRQNTYRQFLSSRANLRVIPVQRAILIEAARLRAANSSWKLPDAIHAATAVILNCTTLLTNDQKFKSLSSLPIVILFEISP
jgi:predicted nucleic acid-binding protein